VLLNIPYNLAPFKHAATATSGGQCLWYFYHEMQVGDLVVLSLGQNKGIQRDVVEITEDYEWIPTPLFPGNSFLDNDYHHIRKSDLDGLAIWASRHPNPPWNRALIPLR
jgi:predicted Mrr-cat superfamily restriction endonuclease